MIFTGGPYIRNVLNHIDYDFEKGKFDRSRYDLLSPLSVFVPIDKSGILYRSPSKIVARQLWKSVVLKIFVLRQPDYSVL